ncbi:MAG: dTDP-4-dehydrorhamnose 3,5-epimerase [Proteobacteria bacterium SG_bin7]|nr:MAG: dTDP-4-dehydrorhamnose 3,5-epimerase [Proteobacteria bacterium SG_bin7]
MQVIDLEIPGLKLIELNCFRDERGFFIERFNEAKFAEMGLPRKFVQDNHSLSQPGVLRGMHYQFNQPQGKLVSVIRGRVFDVAVDLRPSSETFGEHFSVELSAENNKLLWIPGGFAHGFCVLGSEPAEVLYKVDQLYNPRGEGGIVWNDTDLNISWPIRKPILSPKDKVQPSFMAYKKSALVKGDWHMPALQL